MSDSASQRVSCPGCGKGYRWDLGLVGQAVNCRQCGADFAVPAEPGGVGDLLDAPPAADGTYELDLESTVEPSPPPPPLATPANDGKCPKCNSKIADTAVICLNCGLNLREGTVMKPTVSELSAKERKESQPGAIAVGSMKLVRVGMWLHLLSALMVAGTILAAIFAFFGGGWTLVLLDIISVLGVAASLVGSLLCLAAPKDSGGRPVLFVSIVLSVTSLVFDLLIAFNIFPDTLNLLSGLMSIGGTISFLAFFVLLAKHLDFPEITERAEKVFGLYILLLIASLLATLPFIGCIAGAIMLGTLVYSAVLYVLLLIDLNNALSYRIAEEHDDE
ncbi:MAG: hypothetical protein ACIAXF_03120 [Phycisphaerales bacterium JB063]